ncbi:MAG: GH116 family glycosyl-hydrolase [Acidobacteriaceae bacterium]
MTTRRAFLKAAGTATATMAAPILTRSSLAETDNQNTSASSSGHANRKSDSAALNRPRDIQYPRTFSGTQLSRISFPLGGIGTGGIGLGGRGNLTDWEIFNRPDFGNSPAYAFPCIWVKVGDNAPVSRVLERRLLPPYDLKPDNMGSANVPGLPRLAEATFHGSFPTAHLEFHDDALPVLLSLDAYSSFQPIDADLSGLPCALLSYDVRNPGHESAEVVIAWSLENPIGNGSHRRNEEKNCPGAQGILMDDPSLQQNDPLRGTVALAALEDHDGQIAVRAYWRANGWNMGAQSFWFDSFSKTGDLEQKSESRSPIGSVSIRHTIPAGEKRTYRFLLSWHLPNRTPAGCGWEAPKGEENAVLGNYYCTRFADAWAAFTYTQLNLPEIEMNMHQFVQALQTSTLPPAVIEAASANLSTLVSNTSFRIADGSFQGFEGCGNGAGWGFGTCTHVWNYEVATQFLFPSLARSMRSINFGYATDEKGHMDFRHKLPLGKEHWGAAAADGQMGQIVKLYLDWKLSADTSWLRQLWPACKRALAYAWQPGGWDANKDGVMEGVQSNTYDVEFYGPNPLCESWYLAALKSCAEMADAVNDVDFSLECKHLFEQGSRWTDANLFNGEYYIQQVRGIPANRIADGLRLGMGAQDTLHPDFQAGFGCLIDQLLGQYIADLAGMGPLLDESNMRKALASIYRYNYRNGMQNAPSVERAFTLNDESALIMCDYSRSERPEIPFPYYSENFTGSEYAVAILMMNHGMVDEGVECIANIRARYDGEKANPWNEAEYGRHYARAMASWGSIPMLSGFHYNSLISELGIHPLIHKQDFRCFWSTPTAWGIFEQKSANDRSTLTLEVNKGAIDIQHLKLDAEIFSTRDAKLCVGKRPIACRAEAHGRHTVFACEENFNVTPGSALTLNSIPASR